LIDQLHAPAALPPWQRGHCTLDKDKVKMDFKVTWCKDVTAFICLEKGCSKNFLRNLKGFSGPDKRLSASQEGLCFVGLVS